MIDTMRIDARWKCKASRAAAMPRQNTALAGKTSAGALAGGSAVLTKYMLGCRRAMHDTVHLRCAVDAARIGECEALCGILMGGNAPDLLCCWMAPQVASSTYDKQCQLFVSFAFLLSSLTTFVVYCIRGIVGAGLLSHRRYGCLGLRSVVHCGKRSGLSMEKGVCFPPTRARGKKCMCHLLSKKQRCHGLTWKKVCFIHRKSVRFPEDVCAFSMRCVGPGEARYRGDT